MSTTKITTTTLIQTDECYDSDGGRNYYLVGYTRSGRYGNTIYDSCNGEHLLNEGICTPDGKATFEAYNCPYLCWNGACCIDLDNNKICDENERSTISTITKTTIITPKITTTISTDVPPKLSYMPDKPPSGAILLDVDT